MGHTMSILLRFECRFRISGFSHITFSTPKKWLYRPDPGDMDLAKIDSMTLVCQNNNSQLGQRGGCSRTS